MTWTALPATEWILIAPCCMSTSYVTLVALIRHGTSATRIACAFAGKPQPVGSGANGGCEWVRVIELYELVTDDE
jgi:hypothetical protein